MPPREALSTLLSQSLIAYTIEFDNEFEQRAPISTTVGQGAGVHGEVVWLTSQVMWTNFIRFMDDEGTPVHELQALACLSEPAIKSRLHHLEWWRYLTFAPDPSFRAAKPRYRDLLVHLTPGGRRARNEWKPLTTLIDKRWRARFGKDAIEDLKGSLRTIVSGVAEHLPDYPPVVDYSHGMRATLVFPTEAPVRKRTSLAQLDVSALLSRALLALTLEFERGSDVSLTISANVLRVVEEGGTSFKDLPMRAGVAKEGMTAAVNFLKKNGFVTLGQGPAKMVRLTSKGKKAREEYRRTLTGIEKQWTKTFGKETMRELLDSLEALGRTKDGASRLAEGVEPSAGAWRTVKPYVERTQAFLRDPRAALPHHPMILHRGGFPDGS